MEFYTAPIAITGTTGDNTIIAAQGNPIKIYRMSFTVDSSTNITVKNGGSSMSGAYPMQAYGSFQWDFDGQPYYVLGRGESFVLNQSGTANIGGQVWYTKG